MPALTLAMGAVSVSSQDDSDERFLGFLACCAGGLACFFIAFLFLPIRKSSMRCELIHQVALKPRKFALAFTLGSCLFMLGFAILHGPWNRMSPLESDANGRCQTHLFAGKTTVLHSIFRVASIDSIFCNWSESYVKATLKSRSDRR